MKELQNDELEKMKDWLRSAFSRIELINSVYLIGSVLHKHYKETNDTDIVQQIQFENSVTLINYSRTVSLIRDEFEKEFSKPLHVTTFTQNELKEFDEFMSKNTYLKLI